MSEKTKEIKLANQDEAEVKKIILTVFNALK